MTKIAAIGPVDQGCQRWLEFLNTVMDGDRDLIGYLQRYFGYCLTGVTTEHVFQFDFGTGRNGKGVFHNTLRGVMGNYAMSTGMETFTEAYGDRHPTELASLLGARLVTAEEVEEGRRWAENRIKALTGGSPVSARFMRQDFFEYTPSFKLMIAGNHKPGLRDVDQAIRDRIQIVPFRVYIEPKNRDKDLEDKLREEWPGILQWGIDGCLEWQDIGLAPPQAVRAETESYFDTQDVFGSWLEECCITDDPGAWEPPSRLFAGWREYAKENNTKTGPQANFSEKLFARGFHRSDDRKARRWKGIKLTNDPGTNCP
jgi:P4 family phage/plasmid primase-like protien